MLLSCPHKLILDHPKAVAAFPKAFSESVSPHTLLCFFASHERIRGEQSFWWPYFRVLPKTFNTPLYFNDADKKFLNGCNVGNDQGALLRKVVWDEEWRAGVEALKRSGKDASGYTWYKHTQLRHIPRTKLTPFANHIGTTICGLQPSFLRDPSLETSPSQPRKHRRMPNWSRPKKRTPCSARSWTA